MDFHYTIPFNTHPLFCSLELGRWLEMQQNNNNNKKFKHFPWKSKQLVCFQRWQRYIFSLRVRILGGMFNDSFLVCIFLFKVEISLCALIPLLWLESVHSGSASWDSCGQAVSWQVGTWAHFPWWVPKLCLNSIVSPLWLQWIKGVHVFRCNLPSVLLADWLGSATCHCGNTGGWNGHRIRINIEGQVWRRKLSCQESNSLPFNC